MSGKTGPTGINGLIGVRGNSGATGQQGFTGDAGEIYIGPTSTGPTGYDGAQGMIGFTGNRGATGIHGNTGSTGLIGTTIIGSQGPQGPRGATGLTGNYTVGPIGPVGPAGYQGYTGSTGTQGITGYTGFTGFQGQGGYLALETLPYYTGFTGLSLPMPVCANNSQASISALGLVNRINSTINTEGFIIEDFLTNPIGTYTIPQNVYEVEVELQGGGGGGGGSSTTDVGGGGGGSGFNVTKRIPVTPGQQYSYIIGNGGNGGLSGSDGFATTFSLNQSSITALGGKGGGVGLTTIQGGTGGTGGFGGGGGYINNITYPTRNTQTILDPNTPIFFERGYYYVNAASVVDATEEYRFPGPLPPGITQHTMSPDGNKIFFINTFYKRASASSPWVPLTNDLQRSSLLTSGSNLLYYKNRGSLDGSLFPYLYGVGGIESKSISLVWDAGATLVGNPPFLRDIPTGRIWSSTVVGSTGFTAAFADGEDSPMLRHLSNFSAISNDKKYLAIGGGGFSGNANGPTGAVWSYFLGPTGPAVTFGYIGDMQITFNRQITDPQLRMTNTNISFSEPITAGWDGTLLIGGLNNSFQNAAVLWEVGTGTWVKRQTITATIAGSTGEWHIGGATRDVFYTQTEAGLYTLRYMKYPNLTFGTSVIVFQYPYPVAYSVSSDGNYLYVFDNTGQQIAFYQKQTSDLNFTLGANIPFTGGVNNFYGTGHGTSLFGTYNYVPTNQFTPAPVNRGVTGYKAYESPIGFGAGGQSQYVYISEGTTGTTTSGGIGSMNSNVKTVQTYASGGGFGGSFDDSGANPNSGGGGAGRVNNTGTGGGSGYIKVRRFNTGVV